MIARPMELKGKHGIPEDQAINAMPSPNWPQLTPIHTVHPEGSKIFILLPGRFVRKAIGRAFRLAPAQGATAASKQTNQSIT